MSAKGGGLYEKLWKGRLICLEEGCNKIACFYLILAPHYDKEDKLLSLKTFQPVCRIIKTLTPIVLWLGEVARKLGRVICKQSSYGSFIYYVMKTQDRVGG